MDWVKRQTVRLDVPAAKDVPEEEKHRTVMAEGGAAKDVSVCDSDSDSDGTSEVASTVYKAIRPSYKRLKDRQTQPRTRGNGD